MAVLIGIWHDCWQRTLPNARDLIISKHSVLWLNSQISKLFYLFLYCRRGKFENKCKQCFPSWHLGWWRLHEETSWFNWSNEASKVCKLRKCIYGLKQASRKCYNTLKRTVELWICIPEQIHHFYLYLWLSYLLLSRLCLSIWIIWYWRVTALSSWGYDS